MGEVKEEGEELVGEMWEEVKVKREEVSEENMRSRGNAVEQMAMLC